MRAKSVFYVSRYTYRAFLSKKKDENYKYYDEMHLQNVYKLCSFDPLEFNTFIFKAIHVFSNGVYAVKLYAEKKYAKN